MGLKMEGEGDLKGGWGEPVLNECIFFFFNRGREKRGGGGVEGRGHSFAVQFNTFFEAVCNKGHSTDI